MSSDISNNLRPLTPGIIAALLAILLGFSLGGAFGAVEDSIKGHLAASAEAVSDTVYKGDDAAREKVVKKSWSYMKRAHLHGGAIGASALAAILLLAMMGHSSTLEKASAAAFGIGALLYPCFWLAAGLTAPGLGGTHEAKEALQFLAIPGAGLCILGVLGTIVSALRHLFVAPIEHN